MRTVFVMVVSTVLGTAWLSGQAPRPGTPVQAARPPVAAPAQGSASVRMEDWGQMRTAALAVLGWRVGIRTASFRQLTLSEAAAKADALNLANVGGVSSQKLSLEIPKNVDHTLAPGEVTAVRDRLRILNVRMPVYYVPEIGSDEGAIRKMFEFAKGLGVETIIASPDAGSLAAIDKLANEIGINVALQNGTSSYRDPQSFLRAVEGRSKRIGVCADLGNWMLEGIKPIDGLQALRDRIMVVQLRDRSALGRRGRDVVLGSGAGGVPEFLRELSRQELKPSFIAVEATATDDAFADLSRSLAAFERVIQPLMADRIHQMSRAAAIRGPDRLTPEDTQKVLAALPQRAPAKPKKARKLLVLDVNIAYPGHRSIPHANLALEVMGKKTGAWEAVFSNDLDNLKYDRIRQFDAVFLNNTVGMILVDPEVREGLTRFIKEGGGLAGNHGTSHASMDWPEFSEMIGVRQGVHREPTEQATITIDDPQSPLTAVFAGRDFVYQDEFFRFPAGPYSREKLHVLLRIDVEKTDMNQGRPCPRPCVRADHDYAVSWIRSYGKGRVFFCILGHNPTLYMTPPLAEYMLAGIQFILGDLEADTTPSAKLAGKQR